MKISIFHFANIYQREHQLFNWCSLYYGGIQLRLVTERICNITPYNNNPRKNDCAIDAVAESISQCGYVAPIIVDENLVVLAGHTRLKALKKLGYTETQVIIRDGLSEEQKRKYRLLDNKTAELSGGNLTCYHTNYTALTLAALTSDLTRWLTYQNWI